MRNVQDIGTWHLVFNGVPLATYRFVPDPGRDAPLVFLGRIEEIKGPHLAIEIARRVGLHLVIAGNIPNEHRSLVRRYHRPAFGRHARFLYRPRERRREERSSRTCKSLLDANSLG